MNDFMIDSKDDPAALTIGKSNNRFLGFNLAHYHVLLKT